jgi:hypothetical protein
MTFGTERLRVLRGTMASFNEELDGEKWEGEQSETEQVSLMNNGTGKPIIMRVFQFELPPLPPEQFPTPEQLLSVHKTKIMGFLWRDELVPIHEMKCVIDKDKKKFRIFSACQAKAGSAILEKPELLQQHLRK